MLYAQLQTNSLSPNKRLDTQQRLDEIKNQLNMHECWSKIQTELRRRQKVYLDWLLSLPSTGGLMIQRVKPDERDEMIRTKQVVFAISKYGREGLNSPMLDTVIVCEPISKKNGLQQIMGRALRKKEGKKTPVIVFLEDNIGPMMGMCNKLRNHIRNWPVEEGGPYEYELIGHPISNKRRKAATTWTTPRMPVTASTI
jgi:hypothetical protein